MIILTSALYKEILQHIKNFPGLSIECFHHLHHLYPHFSPRTLWSILSWEHRERMPENAQQISDNSPELLQEYEKRLERDPSSAFALLVMAAEKKYSPYMLSQALIKEKLKTSDGKASRLLNNPSRIADEVLRLNVQQCIELDNLMGPVPDAYRDAIGVFFEEMLYDTLKKARIEFHTEKDLRRMGFRKTPDARLLSRCFYRGQRIHWIESKAFFGNSLNHSDVFRRQLAPYLHDFGPGIVIYWMGFVEDILDYGPDIHVRCDFPGPQELFVEF
ncbi:CDAN1-interacting nuclease 1-like [Phlebotomus argentipes]|uniref:CDAN1-interacting nuclease 1-like n=1 Tax=Phlebotomus argentipes TaxID=94469 RepID=UPI0028930601|nr:CDAN1-interacting nuclease 1-like [Phlebotomus argentipes]